jgi:hypothetical protein
MAFNSNQYLAANKDVADWYTDARQEGLHSGEGGVYNNSQGRSTKGWEQGWVDEMNERYGQKHTDVGQFSEDQFAEYHYARYGINEGRGWKSTASKPDEIEHSPEIQQAQERVKSYEKNILSGKTSEDIYGNADYSFDATKGAAGIGTPMNGDSSQQASKATASFLDNKKSQIKDKYQFQPQG